MSRARVRGIQTRRLRRIRQRARVVAQFETRGGAVREVRGGIGRERDGFAVRRLRAREITRAE